MTTKWEDLHLLAEMHRDEMDFWYAVCDCGYRSIPVPDLDLLVDEMMAHAQRAVLVENQP
jgi:hypothetical protein